MSALDSKHDSLWRFCVRLRSALKNHDLLGVSLEVSILDGSKQCLNSDIASLSESHSSDSWFPYCFSIKESTFRIQCCIDPIKVSSPLRVTPLKFVFTYSISISRITTRLSLILGILRLEKKMIRQSRIWNISACWWQHHLTEWKKVCRVRHFLIQTPRGSNRRVSLGQGARPRPPDAPK